MPLILRVDPRNPDARVLRQAAKILAGGGVLAYPTETVYGIGSGAYQAEAILRIHALKRRTAPKPLLILLQDAGDVGPLVREISRDAKRLIDAFWPGPLTIVFPVSAALPEELTQGRGTIGIRVSSSPVCSRLIELAGTPLTSTSANLSGESPLNSIDEMLTAFPPGIDCMLDAGPLPPSPPSSMVDVSGPAPLILRDGAIPREVLERFINSQEGPLS